MRKCQERHNAMRPSRKTAALNEAGRPVENEIALLRDLDLQGLRARWRSVFRSDAPLHLPRHLLFGVLAYRLQADELDELAPDTVRLLKQIGASGTAAETVRLTTQFNRRRIELKPGTVLTREWNGQAHRVMALDEGFAWNGKTYDSLSKIAFAITGTRWNGPRFFGLARRSGTSTRNSNKKSVCPTDR
jgi:hypothetical protein